MDEESAGQIIGCWDLFEDAKRAYNPMFEEAPDPMSIVSAGGSLLVVNARLRTQLKDKGWNWVGRTLMDMIQVLGQHVEVTKFRNDPAKLGRMLVVVGEERKSAPENKPKAIVREMKTLPRVNPAIPKYNLCRLDLEIMLRISTGAEGAEIAIGLGFTEDTITAYIHLLCAKLCVPSVEALVQRGNDLKLLGKNAYWYR